MTGTITTPHQQAHEELHRLEAATKQQSTHNQACGRALTRISKRLLSAPSRAHTAHSRTQAQRWFDAVTRTLEDTLFKRQFHTYLVVPR